MRQSIYTTAKICALTAAFTLVAACENPHLMKFKDEFGWTESKMLSDGWLKSRHITAPQVYCYHTLADRDCYSEPRRSQQHRLVGSNYEGVF